MIAFFRWLAGYVQFEFSKGFYEGFINDCFKSDIPIRDVSLNGDGFAAICPSRYYKRLHKIAFRHGGKVHITKKHGLPFYLKPLKNRMGLAVGGVIFVFTICFLGGFVWNVEIIGNDKISTAQLSIYLDNNNLKSGVMWSSVDRKRLAFEMMRDFDDASWVHINKIGTTARVEINETKDKPEPNISKLKGETVFRKELETTASRQQSSISIKKQKRYYTLHFFPLSIPLYIDKEAADFEETRDVMLTIKSKELPIGYTVLDKKWLASEKYELGDDELLALARKKLALLEESELDGFEIVNKTEDYTLDEESCTISAAYIVRVKE